MKKPDLGHNFPSLQIRLICIMNHPVLPSLLYFYGIFLITCGITAVIFIGPKAKTALVSGGTSGVLAIIIAYLIFHETRGGKLAGIFLCAALFIVFAWRSTKTLFTVFELIPTGNADLKGKGIAFLIISLMAVVSVVVFMLQVISY
jgi:uncharacterized membrane protein (UPF0136 family)